MCELLGLSANLPADIRFSFATLKQRAGNTGDHIDGWGLCAYAGNGTQNFRDTKPCLNSEVAHFLEHNPIKSQIIISHIRKANRGKVSLENTHPFVRELYGKDWVFAHNGQLSGIKRKPLHFYKPKGTTDSEYAFCYLLDQIRLHYPEPPRNPKKLWYFIEEIATEMMQFGVFSFLLSDAKHLYAFCGKKMCWVMREFPFQETRYIDTNNVVDINQHMQREDVMSIIATSPLTENENWTIMQTGDFYVFKDGRPEALVRNRRKVKRTQLIELLKAN